MNEQKKPEQKPANKENVIRADKAYGILRYRRKQIGNIAR